MLPTLSAVGSMSTVMMPSHLAAACQVPACLSIDLCHAQYASANGLSAQIGARAKALTANADDFSRSVFATH